ncbi:MAG: ferritin family protein, partial [Candidatus Bipolaricaulota bacterium]
EDDQLKDHIRKFVEEEKKHERQFREIFSDFFPDRTMEIPDDSVKPAPDLQLEARQGTVGLLKKALESEQESESFYHLLAERLEQQESRRIVAYFASVERDHYEFIRAQLEELGSEEDGHK